MKYGADGVLSVLDDYACVCDLFGVYEGGPRVRSDVNGDNERQQSGRMILIKG